MYICLDCNKLFDSPKKYVVETHGLDTPPYETWTGCPSCGGSYVSATKCDECGDYVYCNICRNWNKVLLRKLLRITRRLDDLAHSELTLTSTMGLGAGGKGALVYIRSKEISYVRYRSNKSRMTCIDYALSVSAYLSEKTVIDASRHYGTNAKEQKLIQCSERLLA